MASLFMRIREMVTAHAHHSLDEAENPHVMAQQVLRGLTQDIHNAQRALVTALGAEKQLTRQREEALREAAEWEAKAERLLTGGAEDKARTALDRAVSLRQRAQGFDRPLATAARTVGRMREQLAHLQTEFETARSRCAQISANHAAAEALGAAGRACDHYTSAMDRAQRLDTLSARASRHEAETEAAAELLGEKDQFEREVAAVDRKAAVDEAMAALKNRLSAVPPPAPSS
jgi:phage shock protein A